MNTHNITQSGRSMVELLGVLAIIGILTILGVIGYKYAMGKQRANTLVHEMHIAYADAFGSMKEQRNWDSVQFSPKSGYNMFFRKDEDGDIFVRVKQVEQEICRLILPLGGHNELRFFRALNSEETEWEEIFTCPIEPIDIVVSFNKGTIPGKNCTTYEDCQNTQGGYCDIDKQVCSKCPENTELSPSKLSCNPICTVDEETSCWLEDAKWCCPNTQICGQNLNECLDSDGFCEYHLEQTEIQLSAECIYEILPLDNTRKADCWYTIPSLSEGSVLSLQEGKGCDKNRYCLLKSENEDCTGTIDKEKTGIIYGTCVEKNESSAECSVKNSNIMIMNEVKGCINNKQYCLLKYTNNSCNQAIPTDYVGRVFGTCAEKNESSVACSPKITTIEGIMSPVVPCPETQYCYLNYSSKGCSNTVGTNGSNPFYGLCLEKNTNKLVCPQIK